MEVIFSIHIERVLRIFRLFGIDQLPAHNACLPGQLCSDHQWILSIHSSLQNGVFSPFKPCCPLIHLPHKFLLAFPICSAICYMASFPEAITMHLIIVSTSWVSRFLQKYRRATHRFRIGTSGYQIIHFQCTILQRIENRLMS